VDNFQACGYRAFFLHSHAFFLTFMSEFLTALSESLTFQNSKTSGSRASARFFGLWISPTKVFTKVFTKGFTKRARARAGAHASERERESREMQAPSKKAASQKNCAPGKSTIQSPLKGGNNGAPRPPQGRQAALKNALGAFFHPRRGSSAPPHKTALRVRFVRLPPWGAAAPRRKRRLPPQSPSPGKGRLAPASLA